MKKKLKWLYLPILLLLFGLSACSKTTDDSKNNLSDNKKILVYGKSQGPYTELFETAVLPILEKQGYSVQPLDFSEVLTNNIAMIDGDVDFNVEQHTAYVDNFNAAYNGDLVPICPIPTVPAGIFSAKHDTINTIENGAIVAVPNDASNAARAYALLQKAGWVKLNSNINLAAVSQDDIIENPYNLEIVEMKSHSIPNSLQDFDYAVLPGSIVYNAAISPTTALLQEDILDHLLLQVVVTEKNKDSDWAKAIVAAYHSEEFKTYMKENNNGLWFIPSNLE